MRRSQPKFWGPTYFRESPLLQHGRIISRFPQFQMSRRGKVVLWTGTLEPIEGQVFTIRIDYGDSWRPKVFLLDPPMREDCPHTYGKGEMCVFWPDDQENQGWRKDSWIADTIIPWSATWLYYYQRWVETGEPWAGPEKSHTGSKE